MKIKVNGNVITVVSDLPFDILETVGKTLVKDANDKVLYAAAVGPVSSISNVGVVFNYATNEGKAAMNIIADCYDQAELAQDFVKTCQDALVNLTRYETPLADAMRARFNERSDLMGMIEVE